MRFHPTRLKAFVRIELDMHADERGGFGRTFCTEEFAAAGLDFVVHQSNISLNPHRHTLRGMHFQQPPNAEPKVVLCTRGRIFDVAIDVRPGSSTYLQWDAVELAVGPEGGDAVYLAPGLAHGFLTLEPDSDVYYLMGAAFVPASGHGLRWDDPAIGVDWPAPPALISDRDAAFAHLDQQARPR